MPTHREQWLRIDISVLGIFASVSVHHRDEACSLCSHIHNNIVLQYRSRCVREMTIDKKRPYEDTESRGNNADCHHHHRRCCRSTVHRLLCHDVVHNHCSCPFVHVQMADHVKCQPQIMRNGINLKRKNGDWRVARRRSVCGGW